MKFFKPFEMPVAPKIPDLRVNIRDYGAVEGGSAMNTAAIAAAIADCAKQGGGHVIFPRGRWLTGPIHFRSNIDLHLEDGCVLEFSENFFDYLPVVESVLAGIRCYSPSHLIYGYYCQNISLTGSGTLDGHGHVWDYMKHHQPGMEDLMKAGEAGRPMEQRVYDKPEQGVRPRFMQLQHCDNVYIDGVTFQNSPTWTVHPVFCRNLWVRNVTVHNDLDAPNSDGINLEACQRCLVEDCYLDTGDDAFCLKAGRGKDAWTWNSPCQDVEVRRITGNCGRGSVTIGSETSASIRNAWLHDCSFGDRDLCINLKTMKGRGGVIENIDFENISVKSTTIDAIRISFRYTGEPLDDQSAPITDVPVLRNVSVKNLFCGKTKKALRIMGLPGYPLQNLSLEDIRIGTDDIGDLVDVVGMSVKNLEIFTPVE